jgi:methylenetetrahydrofolate reductase (NADPH)
MTQPPPSALRAALAAQPLTVDLEILPPADDRSYVVVRRRASALGLRLGAVNVISRPERMSSLQASLHLKARGWEPVWHLVARGRRRDEVEADLDRAAEGGVTNVLCLFGEVAAGEPGQLTTLELIRLLSGRGFFTGAAIDLNFVPLEKALRDARRKAEAGAHFLQTQILYDYEKLLRFCAGLGEMVERPPFVLASTMPVLSLAQAAEIPRRLGVELPEEFARRLAAAPDRAGLELLEEGVAAMRASPAIHGLTLMFLEPDEVAERVRLVEEALLRHLPYLTPEAT